MMTCRQVVELLIDFVSGELPPEHYALVEKHLNKCPPCVTYVRTYELTIRLTRRLPPAPLPEGLCQRLEAGLREILRKKCEGGGE
jgi:anti-sigma factor RsiW